MATALATKDRMEKLLVAREIPRAALEAPPQQAFTFSNLMDVVAEILKDGTITMADKEVVIKAAEDLFEEYIRGVDIPGIPNIIETYVDDLVKSLIRPAVDKLFSHFVSA